MIDGAKEKIGKAHEKLKDINYEEEKLNPNVEVRNHKVNKYAHSPRMSPRGKPGGTLGETPGGTPG